MGFNLSTCLIGLICIHSTNCLGASLILYHWGHAISSNAPSLDQAHFPWLNNKTDSHFANINGANNTPIRQGEIQADFMMLLKKRASTKGNNMIKGGVGYYTSTDFLAWFSWRGSDDVLVLEATAKNLDDLTAKGLNGPILEKAGDDNYMIRRAPTDSERIEKGIHLYLRPPTLKDIDNIFDNAPDKIHLLKEFLAKERSLKHIPIGDQRTPIVRKIFHYILFTRGKNYLLSLGSGRDNGNEKNQTEMTRRLGTERAALAKELGIHEPQVVKISKCEMVFNGTL